MGVLQGFFNKLGDTGLQFNEPQTQAQTIAGVFKDAGQLGRMLRDLQANIKIDAKMDGEKVAVAVGPTNSSGAPFLRFAVSPIEDGGFYVEAEQNSGFLSMMNNQPVKTAAKVEQMFVDDLHEALHLQPQQSAGFLRALKSVYRPG